MDRREVICRPRRPLPTPSRAGQQPGCLRAGFATRGCLGRRGRLGRLHLAVRGPHALLRCGRDCLKQPIGTGPASRPQAGGRRHCRASGPGYGSVTLPGPAARRDCHMRGPRRIERPIFNSSSRRHRSWRARWILLLPRDGSRLRGAGCRRCLAPCRRRKSVCLRHVASDWTCRHSGVADSSGCLLRGILPRGCTCLWRWTRRPPSLAERCCQIRLGERRHVLGWLRCGSGGPGPIVLIRGLPRLRRKPHSRRRRWSRRACCHLPSRLPHPGRCIAVLGRFPAQGLGSSDDSRSQCRSGGTASSRPVQPRVDELGTQPRGPCSSARLFRSADRMEGATASCRPRWGSLRTGIGCCRTGLRTRPGVQESKRDGSRVRRQSAEGPH